MGQANLYRIVWRWHFYAGLFVMPFLVMLAVTGSIYLFNDEINDVLHADKRFASASTAPPLPVTMLVESALKSYPGGQATRLDTPRSPDRTVEVFVTTAAGEQRRVFVNPRTGDVQGSYVYAQTLVGFADVFHGSLLLGDFGDGIVELAACWGVVLVVTGVYLWWPRAHQPTWRSLLPRVNARGRHFWKSIHATTGLWTAALVLFLILSGLPWATLWGGLFRAGIEFAGIGYPQSYRTHGAPSSISRSPGQPSGARPWTLEAEPDPQSHQEHRGATPMSEANSASAPIRLDKALAIAKSVGLADPIRLSLPKGPEGVFVAVLYPDQPQGQRTVYLDQYSGRVLRDIGYEDYGFAAKVVELGVQLHMGNYFGRLNQFVMLVPCVGIVVLAITGPLMWWKRRPRGTLGAPSGPPIPYRALAGIICGLAIIFPLVALSLVIIAALEALTRMIIVFTGQRDTTR